MDSWPDRPFAAAFREAAERYADRIAVVDGDRRLTFRELADASARLASGLAARGVGVGDMVAVWLPNRWEYLVTELALARLGGAVLHVNPRYRVDEVTGIFAIARPRWLVYDPAFLDGRLNAVLEAVRREAPGVAPPATVAVGESFPAGAVPWAAVMAAGEARLDGRASGGGPFALFVTSGTTARPKLVVHTQASVTARARSAGRGLGFGPGRTLLAALPLCGVFGFDSVWATLMAGGTAVLEPVFDPATAAEDIARHGVTDLVGSDTMFFRLLEVPGAEAKLRGLQFGAFASFLGRAAELLALYRGRLGLELVQPYGSSEAQALLSAWRPDDPAELRAFGGGWIFNPAMRVRAVDPETRQVLPADTVGELEISGPELFSGYLNQSDATRAAFSDDGWFRTGDLGYLRADGSFVFLSRLKDSLRLGGFLVDPGEIEQHLLAVPGIRAAQVVGAEDPAAGPVAVAFVQVEDPARFDPEAVRGRLAARIASYKVPRHVWVVDRFPVTAAGTNGEKIQKAELRRMAAERLSAGRAEDGGHAAVGGRNPTGPGNAGPA